MKMARIGAGALLCTVSMTLTLACEAEGGAYEDEAYLDEDADLDEEELLDEEDRIDDEYLYEDETDGSYDDEGYELEPEDLDLTIEENTDPVAANGSWLGGQGGSLYGTRCPVGTVGIGLSVLPTANGQLIRHIGLVCGTRSWVEAGLSVPSSQQWVISTGFRSDVWPHPTHPSHQYPRAAYDVEMALESNQFFFCDPGFAMRGIGARSGAMIDRIENLSCKRIDGGGGLLLYSESVNLGGWGGTSNTSYCTSWHELVDGLQFRSGWQLDGFRSLCSP